MEKLKKLLREDIRKARVRLDAEMQCDNKEAIAFNQGIIKALTTVLLDIKLEIKIYKNGDNKTIKRFGRSEYKTILQRK